MQLVVSAAVFGQGQPIGILGSSYRSRVVADRPSETIEGESPTTQNEQILRAHPESLQKDLR